MRTAEDLVKRLQSRAPELIDLLVADGDAEFEVAFNKILQRAVARLEENKKNFDSLDEVGLTAVLVASLSMPGLSVSQEKHSNGHVDLTIEVPDTLPARKKLGEAKMYDGPAYHVKGLDQLLGRYTTGREGRGLLIVYCKKKAIADLILKIREAMDQDLPHNQQGKTGKHVLKWSFVSTHLHSCGDALHVDHVGFNLCVDV